MKSISWSDANEYVYVSYAAGSLGNLIVLLLIMLNPVSFNCLDPNLTDFFSFLSVSANDFPTNDSESPYDDIFVSKIYFYFCII